MTPQEDQKLEGFLQRVAARTPLKKTPAHLTDAILSGAFSPASRMALRPFFGGGWRAAAACLVVGLVLGGWWTHSHLLGRVPVQFSLAASRASSVALAGDFTNWEMIPLEKRGGQWVTDLKVPKGRFQYAFILNGRVLVIDPNAQDLVTDPRGRTYSVLDTRSYDSI